jgi:hypothetical protein
VPLAAWPQAKITDLGAFNTMADGDLFVAVDVSDTTQAASGSTKKIAASDVRSYMGATSQPLDADLTSWAAVPRASGFDTFTATPSGANLASLLTTALPASKGGTGQPIDADLTSWAGVTRGTGFDTAAANAVDTAGGFQTFNNTLQLEASPTDGGYCKYESTGPEMICDAVTVGDPYTFSYLSSAPAAGSTLHFTTTGTAAASSSGLRIPIIASGTLNAIRCFVVALGTAGSGETGTLAFRYNDTTDLTVSSAVTYSNTHQAFSVTPSQAVTAGDFFIGKMIFPGTWGTPATNVLTTCVVKVVP